MAEISAQAVKDLRDKTGAGMMDCKRVLSDANGDVEKAVELLRERGLAKAVKRGGRETTEGTIAMAFKNAAAGLVELGCETDFVAKTPDFQTLATELAEAVAADPDLTTPDRVMGSEIDGESIEDRIKAMIGKLGENIVLKRVARLALEGAGQVGGYVHAGGKLGVVVALACEASSDEIGALAKDIAMHVAAADPTPIAVERDGVPEELVQRERDFFRKQALTEGKPEKIVDKIVDGRINKFYSEVCLVDQPFVKDPDRTVKELLADVSKKIGSAIQAAGFQRFKLGEADES